jgi:hypothetical protein
LGLKNNSRLMNKILNGCDGYPYYLFKRIRDYVTIINNK